MSAGEGGEGGPGRGAPLTSPPALRSGCDNCNEWFHGDCIRITEKMAKAIREWYCRECRGEAATAGTWEEGSGTSCHPLCPGGQ